MQRLLHVMMLFMIFSLSACQLMTPEPEKLPENVQLGERYYTQVTMQYEKGKYRTTNYRRGTFIGVNTEVSLLEITPKSIKLKLVKENLQLWVVNVPKHTGDDVYQAFDKLLAKTKVNLSHFNLLEQENINKGSVAKGMSKLAVKVAIGYPPITRTTTLDSDQWTYWNNRFNTFIVHFENDKVVRIQD